MFEMLHLFFFKGMGLEISQKQHGIVLFDWVQVREQSIRILIHVAHRQ